PFPVFLFFTDMRSRSHRISPHLRASTSDGQRSPPNRQRATMSLHSVSGHAAMILEASSQDTKWSRLRFGRVFAAKPAKTFRLNSSCLTAASMNCLAHPTCLLTVLSDRVLARCLAYSSAFPAVMESRRRLGPKNSDMSLAAY